MSKKKNTLHRLKGTKIYQIGPIDNVKDGGVEWREYMSGFLWSLGCGVLNPCDKPTTYADESEETRKTIQQLKQDGINYQSWEENEHYPSTIKAIDQKIVDIMKPIVNIDLRMVDSADFMVMYIDTDTHMCGSYGEQAMACLQRKPVIIYCKQGKYSVPNWLWGICKPEMFFSSWEEVKEYLIHINQDNNIDRLGRWHFFDQEKIYGNAN